MDQTSSHGPVFLLTLHRAGGTVLARVLNCHPELVIWGEHVGLINRLAEIDDMVTRVGRLMAPKTDEAIAEYVAFPDRRLTEFDPWANPFDYDAFSRSCREMIETIFTRGLRPGQRWGFQGNPLSPRNDGTVSGKAVSRCAVHHPAARHPRGRGVGHPRILVTALALGPSRAMSAEMAEAIVRDVTYALLAIESGLDAVQTELGLRCLQLDYSQLLDPALGFVAPLFGFLELALSDQVTLRIHKVLKVRAGGTDQEVCFGGILSRNFIRARVTAMRPSCAPRLPAAASTRPDWSRRRELDSTRTWPVDHTMRDRGCEFSSLF